MQEPANERIQAIYNLLIENKIDFTAMPHAPVYTIDEMAALHLPNMETIAKNLFVRDDKKQQYYLLVVREEKRVALKELRERLGTRPLTFASETDLLTILGLQRGAVTPFGVLNDRAHRTRVLIDATFSDSMIGIHPNENTATVWLKTGDLVHLLRESGAEVEFLEF